MSKRVYISADYSSDNGDREVTDVLRKWGEDNLHKTDFIDMAQVISGSVSSNPDCRACDLKKEFNQQISASSAVIFIVGDQTKNRSAGSECYLAKTGFFSGPCTPYKHNSNGQKSCKVFATVPAKNEIGSINQYSYLQHEFEQAKYLNKTIIIVYNSLRKEESWLPAYMDGYEGIAQPFWIKNAFGEKVGDYGFIKKGFVVK